MYELESTLSGHSNWVRAVAVFADGKRVMSGSYDGTVKIWDAETGEELRTLSGHSDWVNAVAVFADGKRVVSGCWDGTVKIWDVESGAELCTLWHSNPVTCVAVLPDGRVACGEHSYGENPADVSVVKIWKRQQFVPTKRVINLLRRWCLSALNEDVMEIIMKYAVALKGELAQFKTEI